MRSTNFLGMVCLSLAVVIGCSTPTKFIAYQPKPIVLFQQEWTPSNHASFELIGDLQQEYVFSNNIVRIYRDNESDIGSFEILYDSKRVYARSGGKFQGGEFVIAPDGQSVAWTIIQQRGERNEEMTLEAICDGTLWTAHAGQKPIRVMDTRSSRGFILDCANSQDEKAGWHPLDLRWDSTSQYLYFTTSPWMSHGLLWQVKHGDRIPRVVDSGGEYWLVKQPTGPDAVVIQRFRYELNGGVKNYDRYYLYTVEDIAEPEFVPSEKRVQGPRLGIVMETKDQGVSVINVQPDSVAENAGLQIGDMLCSFRGSVVRTPGDLVQLVRSAPLGQELQVVILRNGKRRVLTVVLGNTVRTPTTNDPLPPTAQPNKVEPISQENK